MAEVFFFLAAIGAVAGAAGTVALRDANGDGVIGFGRNRRLDLDGEGSSVAFDGGRVRALEYDGFVDQGGIRYFVYSAVGSAAGVETLAGNGFLDLLG